MKKKGLIVATIVMVLVLAVSLTTATYAWFSNTAAAEVDAVAVSVASASNISIGIAKTKGSARNTVTNYVNGHIAYTETSTVADKGKGLGNFASSDNLDGLGLSVNWDWVLASLGGVSSYNPSTTDFDVNAQNGVYSLTNPLWNGTETTTQEGTEIDPTTVANFNGNVSTGDSANTVIFAPFGIRVEKPELNYLYCDIDITATGAFWGIVTSLKVEIFDGTTTRQYHPFAATTDGGLLASEITYQDATSGTNSEQNKYTFRFIIAYDASHICYNGEKSTTTPAHTAAPQIYQFDLRMFLDGANENCNANATQYGATIGLKFNAVNSTDYAGLTAADGLVNFTA